jgi:REP element-mobilizing transposase RayT
MLSDDSVSKIIRWYKGRTSFFIRKTPNNSGFAWQARFHDRIIRDEQELDNTRQYIMNNPLQWELDENNPDLIARGKK